MGPLPGWIRLTKSWEWSSLKVLADETRATNLSRRSTPPFMSRIKRHLSVALCALCVSAVDFSVLGQQSQNASPMVEHTREHPRLTQQTPPGRRIPLELGELFIPAKLQKKQHLPLVIHFH